MADVEGGGEMRREREILFYLILEGLQTPAVLCNWKVASDKRGCCCSIRWWKILTFKPRRELGFMHILCRGNKSDIVFLLHTASFILPVWLLLTWLVYVGSQRISRSAHFICCHSFVSRIRKCPQRALNLNGFGDSGRSWSHYGDYWLSNQKYVKMLVTWWDWVQSSVLSCVEVDEWSSAFALCAAWNLSMPSVKKSDLSLQFMLLVFLCVPRLKKSEGSGRSSVLFPTFCKTL